jgi:lipocalin-like protein
MKSSLLKLSLSLIVLLLSVSLISSCKKDKDKTRSELIIGRWKLVSDVYSPAYDYDGDGTKETDIFPLFYDACEKDDIIIISAGGNGVFDQGATKCDQADPQTDPFNWSLTNNDAILIVDGNSVPIAELTNSTLKLNDTFAENGVTYTNTLTYAKQ